MRLDDVLALRQLGLSCDGSVVSWERSGGKSRRTTEEVCRQTRPRVKQYLVGGDDEGSLAEINIGDGGGLELGLELLGLHPQSFDQPFAGRVREPGVVLHILGVS